MTECHQRYAWIALNKGKRALVDCEDAMRLGAYRWRINHAGYAVRDTSGGRVVFLHNEILGARPRSVDHVNLDRLDNRRENLRFTTEMLNKANLRLRSDNSTGFKGVSRRRGKWRATINCNGRQRHLGDFGDPQAAAIAYDDAARTLFGEFARLNFPNDDERGAL